MDKLREFTERITDGWRELSRIKKISVVLATTSIIIVLAVMTLVSTKTNYAILYTDLAEAEAGAIVKELDAQGIKYKVESNGTTILVDEIKRDKFRMNLAVENKLPSSSTGFEIFDKTNMMATDEDRKIMYQRAVTGELQRAIEALDGVKTAKVMLVIPDKSIFEKKATEATASIVLSLAGRNALSDAAIQGIGSLVSGAVENLPTKNIKIVDEAGNLLSISLAEGDGNKGTDLASKYQAFKQEFERNLENKTTSLLSGAFPADKVKLSVNVDLDFDSIEKTTVKYDKAAVRSENVKVSGANVDIQQVQGGNINDNIGNVVGGEGQENNSYDHSVNNELDTETTKVINAPGVVKRISASVLINGTLTPQESQKLRGLVQTAIGFEANRGDQIAIEGIQFDNTDNENSTDPTNPAKSASLFAGELGEKILLGLGGLITLLLVLVTALVLLGRGRSDKSEPKARGRKAKQAAEVPLDVTSQVKRDVRKAPLATATNGTVSNSEHVTQLTEVTDNPIPKATISAEEALIAQKEQELAQISTEKEQRAKRYAKDNPDLAAELIKVWMKEK